MKKKIVSLMMLFGLSLSFVNGCKNGNGSSVDKLNKDGKDIVLKVGNTTYSADDLFGDLLSTTSGVEAIYEKILKMVVENSIEVDVNMQASWDLLLESFEKEVDTYAATNGVSKKEAKKQLLTEQGYSSIEEKKEAYFYDVKLNKLQDKYWEEKKESYFESYFDERLPYYVKHILVKTGYTADRGAYSSIIDSDDATDLYDVYNMLVQPNAKFNYVMHEKSEDTGSNNSGQGYYMDLTTSFVSEFLHGVYTFDALLKGKQSEVLGLTSDVLNFYASSVTGTTNDYGFGFINASDIVALGNSASSYTSNNITIYEDVVENDETVEKSTGSNISSAYGSSSSSLYSRTVIFNQTFNNAAINVIAYDLDDATAPKNVKEIKLDGKTKKVLTDENGNIIFVVCARGDSSDLWVHFLTVNVSPFDENAKLFFSRDQEKTIEEMVSAKKEALVAASKTETEIATELDAYKKELEKYKTYVDIKGGTTSQSSRNKIIEELESYVKNYAQRGSDDAAEQYLTYDMVDYYMEKGAITFSNDNVKKLVQTFINEKRILIEKSTLNTISTGWADYYKLIEMYNSDEIKEKRIPLECSYAANGANDSLCKYRYDTGYHIKLTFDVNGGDALDAKYDNYYYQIGGEAIVLPVPTKSGSTFLGWYTTKEDTDTEKGVLVEKINNDRTSTLNKTKLYARWQENNA